MSALKNTRHERFAQELAKGKSQRQSYVIAGYKTHISNPSKLAKDKRIVARVAELGSERAKIDAMAVEKAAETLGIDKTWVMARLVENAERALQRGLTCYSERAPGGELMAAERIAIGTAHRDQAQAIRARLGPLAGAGVVVDTANRLQGREYDLVIVLHPLSGRRDATAFHLEAGRLCVLTSRHRHACIVVARAGIAELLDAHPAVEPVHLNVPAKFPDGWAANQTMLAHLSQHCVRVR